jgi:hypothetical protein
VEVVTPSLTLIFPASPVTLGEAGQRWDNIDATTAIAHIQTLEDGNDTFYKIWHADDVLSPFYWLNPADPLG